MDQPEVLASATAVITRAQYQTTITSRQHTLIADEPEDKDGTDTGMTPYELLLASLSSCTAITLQMYINRKMWIVEQITINQELFVEENKTLIKNQLSFKGDLTPEQCKRLEIIAEKCPVHKILIGEIRIETEIV